VRLTHLDDEGRARMVDISQKEAQLRTARASGRLRVSPQTLEAIRMRRIPKGGPFEAARLAGIQAAKQTAALIPLCHQIQLDWVDVEFDFGENSLEIRSEVRCRWATGVEMEALTAVAVAALTLYDMLKAVDKGMTVENIQLEMKSKSPAESSGGSVDS
jgi:cyclic pyranopterin monophosphate synthase